ncbi:MAG TPA: energy transducer TonB [Steroidobacter sp.]
MQPFQGLRAPFVLVPLSDLPRKCAAGFVIVAVHVLALYALAFISPSIERVRAQRPISLSFVAATPEPKPEWRLPEVRLDPFIPELSAPDLPSIEFPASGNSPADRAITQVARTNVAAARVPDEAAPKLITSVEYVREPAPRYPPQSRRLREEGLVVLEVLIDEQGRAKRIQIETSSGYRRLDEAALEAVRAALFRPYTVAGEPRQALVRVPIEFALNRSLARRS